MKLSYFVLFIAFNFTLASLYASPTFAQSQEYSTYLSDLNKYQDLQTTFQNAKTRYRSFKTAQSQQAAFTAGLQKITHSEQLLTNYLILLDLTLQQQKVFDQRIHQLIQRDLNIHREYLIINSGNVTLDSTVTELNIHAQALQQRLQFVSTTANQIIAVIKVNESLNLIQKARDILFQVNELAIVLPDELRDKSLVLDWVNQSQNLINIEEEQLLKSIPSIYPDNTSGQLYFELQSATYNNTITNAQDCITQITNQLQKSDESLVILEKLYQQI